MKYTDFYNKVNSQNIDYLIGIDFGHGETTASYYDINGKQSPKGAEKLHKLMLSNDGDRKKVYSAFYTSKEGKSSLVTNKQDFSKPGIRAGFKAPIADIRNDWRCDAMRQYIKLVFEAIKEHNGFINKSGQPNYLIFVACPSQWTELPENAASAYKAFIEGSGMPVELMLKESDAAFLKWRHVVADKNVLVIDLGSSTIDFTAYKDSKRIASLGRPCGASKIEHLLSDFCNPNAAALDRIKNWMKSRGVDSSLIEESCLLFIREKKEHFYTHCEEENDLGIDISVRESQYTDVPSKERLIDCELSKAKVNEIVRPYNDELRKVLDEIKDELREDHQFIPNHVILSGGASRMYFVKDLINEIFNCNEDDDTLQVDKEPEYVVSDGLAKYAAVRYDVATKTKAIIDEFIKWAEIDDNLINIYSKCLMDALLETQLIYEKDAIYSKYVNSEYNTSYEDFISVAEDTIDALNTTHRAEFENKTSVKLNAQINKQIVKEINRILEKQTGKKVHLTEVVDITTIPEGLMATSGYLRSWISDFAVDIHSDDVFRKTPNYTKPRNRSERERIAACLIDKENGPEGKWIDNSKSTDSRRELVNDIVESVCLQIEKVIIEYELFDTIY